MTVMLFWFGDNFLCQTERHYRFPNFCLLRKEPVDVFIVEISTYCPDGLR